MSKIKKCKRGNKPIRNKHGVCHCVDCKNFRRQKRNEYNKSDKRKDWNKKNRSRLNELQLKWNEKNRDKIKKIQKKYRDANKEKSKIYNQKYKSTASAIYSQLYKRKRSLINITKNDFIKWYNEQERKCCYCDIPEIRRFDFPIFFVGGTHTRLSIDRMDNNKGYENENMALSCSRCNGTKSDFFTFKEMREIAQKYIKPKWNTN